MSWVDEQIKTRIQSDNDVFEDSFIDAAGVIMGKKISAAMNDSRRSAADAIGAILNCFHIKQREIPDDAEDMNELLADLLRPHGIMRRHVRLESGWYKDASGPMIGSFKEDGSPVALLPFGFSHYCFYDPGSGKRVLLNRNSAKLIDGEAIAFYKPFPLKKIGIPGLMAFMLDNIRPADVLVVIFAMIAVTAVGFLNPALNKMLFSDVIESGSMSALLAVAVFMVCVSLSLLMLETVKGLLMSRLSARLNLSIEAATMMRLLALPASFFKKFASGELASRANYVNSLAAQLLSLVLSSGLSSLLSLAYITQIFAYAPALVGPAMLVIVVTVVFTMVSTLMSMRVTKMQMEASSRESGMSYALISGVQKIKLSGSEKRVFARWVNSYLQGARLQYDPPTFIKVNSVISMAISLIGTLIIYYAAAKSGVSEAEYFAFNTAYGMVSGAFMSLAGMALTAAQIKPVLDMVRPILETEPEQTEGKHVMDRLKGGIELNNITFAYGEDMPNVLEGVSLKIKPGEYVALVGKTGCGKSTMMRIMLGFEKPQKGAVYYDGIDLERIDLRSLRKKIGTVMQSGKLFSGDIYSNIVITNPRLTVDEAWDAAEMAGFADDIRSMPMGMYTMISEGQGGISGGQRQRLLIARAIAPKPKILMFDEATSALDNITQKVVSDSLAGLKCTRVVIAHRLSTIKQCDRIIVLDGGRIIGDGSYDELLKTNSFFADLVERQRVDI